MKIQQHTAGTLNGARQLPAAPRQESAPEPKDSVTLNKKTNSYDYQGQSGTRSVARQSILKEALKGAALAGIPAALGVAEGAVLGKAVGTIAILPNAGFGAVTGIGVGAYQGYKEATEGRLAYEGGGLDPAGLPRAGLYGFFGGIGGAIGGAVLPLSGLYGGVTGALVATGVFAAAGAYFAITHNNKVDQEAVANGYQPQG